MSRQEPVPHAWGTHAALGPGGEFDAVRALLAGWGDLARGVGDDAAVLDLPAGERLVVSTDASVEDVHFRRGWLTPEEVAWRAGMSALSDLAAMAARPIGVLVAIALPHAWRDALPALGAGLGAAVREAGTVIVGGDLTSGRSLAITVTVLGAAAHPVGRGGAQPGDALYVTGRLGGPLLALRAFERGDAPTAVQRERFARPRARIAAGRWLAERGARALIDVSDGLAADLAHIAAASGVRCVLDGDRVPCIEGAALADALASGEEYELACAAPTDLDVDACLRETGVALACIGHVAAGVGGDAGPHVGTPVEVRAAGPDGVPALVDLPPGHDHLSRRCGL
jgi:thiamine-monophosphate kinase